MVFPISQSEMYFQEQPTTLDQVLLRMGGIFIDAVVSSHLVPDNALQL